MSNKKVYYITNAGLKLKIEKARVIQIKALQLFYKERNKGNQTITIQECTERVKKEVEQNE